MARNYGCSEAERRRFGLATTDRSLEDGAVPALGRTSSGRGQKGMSQCEVGFNAKAQRKARSASAERRRRLNRLPCAKCAQGSRSSRASAGCTSALISDTNVRRSPDQIVLRSRAQASRLWARPYPNDRIVGMFAYMALMGGHFGAGRYAECADWARNMIELFPDHIAGHNFLTAALAIQGEMTAAAEAGNALLRLRPEICSRRATHPMPNVAPEPVVRT